MAYPRSFLTEDNFLLAYRRVVSSLSKQYLDLYPHLVQAYNVTVTANLKNLIKRVRRGYEPSAPVVVYEPKANGILRPLTLLVLEDLIVYQAIVNVVAEAFRDQQNRIKFDRAFSHILASPQSQFFFRHWKYCHRQFDDALVEAYRSGNTHVAEFDLAAFYDLIDHELLRLCISAKLKNPDLTDLLHRCLRAWTEKTTKTYVGHGIPQGPAASAFLAECFLFEFDKQSFSDVRYFRYVDDIRLMGPNDNAVRRAMVQLDLMAKRRGLVPQSEKLTVGEVKHLSELRRSVPSVVDSLVALAPTAPETQRKLRALLKASWHKKGSVLTILNATHFKYALRRIRPNRRIIARLFQLLRFRPDCAWHVAEYCKNFVGDKQVIELLRQSITKLPNYDNVSANLIDALDCCWNSSAYKQMDGTFRALTKKSLERSPLLLAAIETFVGRRAGRSIALRLIRNEPEPLVKARVLSRLFSQDVGSPYRPMDALPVFEDLVRGADQYAARFATYTILTLFSQNKLPAWQAPANANWCIAIMMKALKLQRLKIRPPSLIKRFLEEEFAVSTPFQWEDALGSAFANAEGRVLQLKSLIHGSRRTEFITLLDTFNDALIQSFSESHPLLKADFRKAARGKSHPDFGAWLRDPALGSVLPLAVPWLKDLHSARSSSTYAHARISRGPKKGRFTRPVPYWKAVELVRAGKTAYSELIFEWQKIL
jgi:hypothetical protein